MSARRGWTKEDPLQNGESTICRDEDADVEYIYDPIEVTVTLGGERQIEFEFEGEIAEALADKVVRARLTCNGEGHTHWYWVVLSDE